jgi:hypothetical protein
MQIINIRIQEYGDLRDKLIQRRLGQFLLPLQENNITLVGSKIRVFNWDATQVFKGDFVSINMNNGGQPLFIVNNCRIENFYRNDAILFADWWPYNNSTLGFSKNINIQVQNQFKIGIVRVIEEENIDIFFEKLKNEIKIRELNYIVLREVDYGLPETFHVWCNRNLVYLEFLTEEELNILYPQEHDIFWEDELFGVSILAHPHFDPGFVTI